MVGVVLVFRDLTEPKEAEQVQLSLSSIVESSEDAIIGERPDGTITSWNDAAVRIFGYTAEELIGANITALTPEGRGDDSFDIVQRIQRGEHVRHYETMRRRKDGTEIIVDLSISPIRDAAGRIVGASEIARDITDRKRLQEQIVYSQKVESLGVLAGGIAHDFNNLLMGITANATLILEAPSVSAATDLAQNVLIATEQASHLTRQMLHYSGKGRFLVEPIGLTKQIENIVLLFRSSIPKGVELRLELDANLPPINADAGQIQQLVTNLVLNGAEAIGSFGVVTISATLQELTGSGHKNLAGNPVPPGTYARLEVRDTGHGIDEVTRARIFDPFFTTKFTGRGLGLAAVLGIVRGHKGGISVSSEPGKGTTFQVFFPVEVGRRVLHAKI
jgi:PAS domain S-box-containing protein